MTKGVSIKELFFLILMIITITLSISSFFHDSLFMNSYYSQYKDLSNGVYNESVFEEHDLDSFKNYVDENYEYILDVKDCKFYAILWKEYFEYKGWNAKFITTDSHIFTVAYHKNIYCVADQNKLDCTTLNG